MNDLLQYRLACPNLRPGDIIAFSGVEPISYLIKFFAGTPISHMAMVRQAEHWHLDATVTHSTLDSTINGAGTVPLGQLIAGYGSGAKVSAFLLKEDFRKTIDWYKFYAYIGACEGYVHYDVEGLFGFLARELPGFGPYICQTEDPKQMFCDAYVISILKAAGALHHLNSRKLTPQDVAEMALYSAEIPLLGPPLKIRNFNSIT